MSATTHKEVRLTQAAADYLLAKLKRMQHAPCVLLTTKPTGCNGWAYHFEPVEEGAYAHTFVSCGVIIYVDAASFTKVVGTTIDFVEELDGLKQNFKFINPNATSECGCGESFTVKT